MTDSTNSCPLVVNVYSTLANISLYACLSRILFSSNSMDGCCYYYLILFT